MATPTISRATFTVVQQDLCWAVEHGSAGADSFQTRRMRDFRRKSALPVNLVSRGRGWKLPH